MDREAISTVGPPQSPAWVRRSGCCRYQPPPNRADTSPTRSAGANGAFATLSGSRKVMTLQSAALEEGGAVRVPRESSEKGRSRRRTQAHLPPVGTQGKVRERREKRAMEQIGNLLLETSPLARRETKTSRTGRAHHGPTAGARVRDCTLHLAEPSSQGQWGLIQRPRGGAGDPARPVCSSKVVRAMYDILESACQAAEQTLIDQRLFVVSGNQARSLLELLERPTEDNAGLRDLFSRPEPWETR